MGLAGCANEVDELVFVGVNADNDELLVFMLFDRLVDELLILIFIGLEACCIDVVPLFIVVPLMPKPMLLLPLLVGTNTAPPLAPPPILERSAFKFCKKPLVPPKSVEEFKAVPVKVGFVPPPLPPLPPLPAEPKSVLPLRTVGAEVLRLIIGVGNAGLMKRSLARRFWKN